MNPETQTNDGNNSTPPSEVKKESFLKEVIKFLLIAVFVVLPFRFFIAQPFIVDGASMDPTFETGEYLIVDQISYKFEEPQRGSVVIFKYPKDTSKFFIKRVIGLPDETVKIKGEEVTIINKDHPNGFTLAEPYIAPSNRKEDNFAVTLKDKEFFVMGDNRVGSSDSRAWGPVPESLIVGRPFIRLLPLQKTSVFPGSYDEK
jgi:signal peptidase I